VTRAAHPTRRSLMAGATSLSCLAAAGCARSRTRALSAADTHPDGYPTVEALKFFAKRVEELTGGGLRVKTFSGGQLGEEKDTLELTIFGGIDFNRVNLAPLNSIASLTRVPALPFLFRSVDHMRRAMDGAPGEKILASLEPYGLMGLCFYDSGARSFYNVKRPVRNPDDLAGLKIRVQNSDIFVAMVRALGANATPMPYGEVYQGLVQGVVDGAENNWPSFESSRHFEVAKHYSLTRHVMAPEVLVMSARAWARLDADTQRAVRTAARESVPFMRALWETREARARDKVVAAGVEVIENIDTEPFSALMGPVWAPILEDPASAALIDEIRRLGVNDA